MKTNRFALALAVFAFACGGAQKTSKKEMTELAAEAPPPPSVTPGQKVEREVSKEAKAEFTEAVKFFQEQDKAGAWTLDKCTAAASKFEAVASAHDKMVEAYFNAGVAYQKCGDAKNAEAMYQRAISINPSHAPSLANLGEIYFRGGNEERGKQYFEQAVKADPKITAARNNLAWILYTKIRKTEDAATRKRYEDEALGHLQRVLAVDNDNIVAYTIMALLYMEGWEKNKSRLDVAKLLLEEGKKRKDNYAPLYNAWGLLYLHRQDVSRALEQFRRAVELDPSFTEARMNVAQLVLSFRKYDEAEQQFRAVLDQKGISKEVRYDATVGLGVALRGQKKIDEAAAMYEAAMKLMPERGDAYYNMGVLWKDYKTNEPDAKSNKAAYIRAKGFFQQYLSKADAKGDKRKEAQDNIEDCDKYVAQLDQAIQQMESAPPPPPQPAPAPAAGGASNSN